MVFQTSIVYTQLETTHKRGFNNANTCKCCQVFMIIIYVNKKSSSFHSTGVGYTIRFELWKCQVFVVPRLYNINLD